MEICTKIVRISQYCICIICFQQTLILIQLFRMLCFHSMGLPLPHSSNKCVSFFLRFQTTFSVPKFILIFPFCELSLPNCKINYNISLTVLGKLKYMFCMKYATVFKSPLNLFQKLSVLLYIRKYLRSANIRI